MREASGRKINSADGRFDSCHWTWWASGPSPRPSRGPPLRRAEGNITTRAWHWGMAAAAPGNDTHHYHHEYFVITIIIITRCLSSSGPLWRGPPSPSGCSATWPRLSPEETSIKQLSGNFIKDMFPGPFQVNLLINRQLPTMKRILLEPSNLPHIVQLLVISDSVLVKQVTTYYLQS